ncbi:MAG: DUF481 domain-containing protein [Deltaproteobacteria bacterium]|nr:DUF481 domain-containing protein [Deltaproteobacteria bacterium]
MRALLILLSLALATPAAAQIVNVQSRFDARPEDGLHGALSGSADWRTGNTEYLALRLKLSGTGSFGDHLILLAASAEYGVASGADEPFLSRLFEHLRYRHAFGELVSAEAFVQHEYDRFRKLQLRFLAGAGLRLDLVSSETWGAAIGLAAMLDHEELIEGRGQATVGRFSSYLIGRASLSESLSLTESVYAQPRIDLPSDIRLLSETSLNVKAAAWLSVAVSFTLAWDSDPPADFDPEVQPLDTQFKTTVAVSF